MATIKQREGSLYDRLSENVEKLQNLGKSWGMSDREIDKCIQQALQCDRRKSTTFMSKFLYSLRICALVLSFLIAFYIFLSFHRPTQQFISKQTQSWQYPIMRLIRLFTLPITKKYKLEVFHELECLVDNPFYSDEPMDCWACETVNEIQDFTGFDNFSEFYYHNGIPFYVTDADGTVVTFEILHDLYWDHQDEMDSAIDSFICSNSSITSLEAFYSEKHTARDFAETDIGVMWRTQRVAGVRLLRDLFPRPYFVPEKAEVTLEKYVFIDSPKAEPFQIPGLQAANGWLSQGSGQREIVLLPSPNCHQNCTDISVVLQPMDILFYHTHYWKPESFPYGDEVSVMFAGSFF